MSHTLTVDITLPEYDCHRIKTKMKQNISPLKLNSLRYLSL